MARTRDEPHLTDETKRRAEEKRRRLAEELRANLARRKRQDRARESGTKPTESGPAS
jgi:hypothetical protein